jgi:outer membrane biogenesis lipoprotein LolB
MSLKFFFSLLVCLLLLGCSREEKGKNRDEDMPKPASTKN